MYKRMSLLTLLWLLCWLGVWAQRGLHVSPVFEGEVVPRKSMIETLVRGESLQKYKLQFFRSVKMNVPADKRGAIADRVLRDASRPGTQSLEKEVDAGQLTYCILQLADRDGRKRYLCYQSYEAARGGYNIVLVYMEGWATLADLHQSFKRK